MCIRDSIALRPVRKYPVVAENHGYKNTLVEHVKEVSDPLNGGTEG